MIYVDSTVPMYLVGAEHVNKRRIIELVPQLISARERLVTSAETFQEIVHRYRALRDRRHLNAAYEALEAIVSAVAEVTKADVDGGRAAAGQHPRLCVASAVPRCGATTAASTPCRPCSGSSSARTAGRGSFLARPRRAPRRAGGIRAGRGGVLQSAGVSGTTSRGQPGYG